MNLHLKPIIRVLFSIGSGILLFLSFPSFNFFLLEWIALVPLLFAIEGLNLRQTYLLGLITGMVTVAGGFYWMVNWAETAVGLFFPFNLMFGIGYAFVTGQVFGIASFFFQWFRKQNIFHDLILLPVVFVSVFSLFPMLFYFKLGDGQSHFFSAIQAIEFTGVYGLDFVLVLVNILIYKTLQIPKEKTNRVLIIFSLSFLISWFAFGLSSYASWNREIRNWPIKKIGLVQPNRKVSLSRPTPEKGYSRQFPLEMEMSYRLAEQDAEIVFWPEGNFFGYQYWSGVRDAFRDHLKRLDIPLVFCDSMFKTIEGRKSYYNSSLLLNRDGFLAETYHKIKLVPFGEQMPFAEYSSFLEPLLGDYQGNLTPGTRRQVFNAAGMRIVPSICYEPLFPEFMAEAIGEDSKGKVLLVQTQDGWFGKTSQSEQHLAISALRAVENRVPLIHVINNGASAVIQPNGQYAFLSEKFVQGYWVAEMPYHPDKGGSFYSRYPYFFINLIRFVFLIFLFAGFYTKHFSNIES